MKVSIIDYTGKGNADPLYAARLLAYTKATRLTQGEDGFARFMALPEEQLSAELEYISKTLRSSWEFVDFVIQIEGVTRAFTHQLVRTRTASYAQQAQRVVDLSSFDTLVPGTVAEADGGQVWAETMDAITRAYGFYQKHDVPNQDCRGLLPTNVLTNIMMKVNLRTLADLVGKRDNLRTQGEYADVMREIAKKTQEVMPWINQFLYPERTATPALTAILTRLLGSASPIDKPEINDALKELDGLKGIWG